VEYTAPLQLRGVPLATRDAFDTRARLRVATDQDGTKRTETRPKLVQFGSPGGQFWNTSRQRLVAVERPRCLALAPCRWSGL